MRGTASTVVAVVVAGVVGCAASPVKPTTVDLNPGELVAGLRQGGYVLYLRHGLTDQSRPDAPSVDLTDCDSQRPLSAEGRRQALAILRGFKRLGIPVGQVLASPYCRCMDTARLAFGRAEADADLATLDHGTEAETKQRLADLETLLTTVPTKANTILVSHRDNLNALAEIALAEGEMAIFRPQSKGELVLVGRISANQWATMPKT